MGVLSFLPLVGATLVWLPAAVWLVLSGSLAKGIGLLLVGLLIMGNVDNVIRPLLLSGKSRMNTLVMLISLLGGVSAFGFIGIVLGPLVAAVVTALVESYSKPVASSVTAVAAAPAPTPEEAAPLPPAAPSPQPVPPPPVAADANAGAPTKLP